MHWARGEKDVVPLSRDDVIKAWKETRINNVLKQLVDSQRWGAKREAVKSTPSGGAGSMEL